MVITTSEATFDDDILGKEAALVDFSAAWCGPCKAMAPVFEAIAEQYGQQLTFAKLDTDACPALSAKYGVRGIPTFVLFKQGERIASLSGMIPKSELINFIEENL